MTESPSLWAHLLSMVGLVLPLVAPLTLGAVGLALLLPGRPRPMKDLAIVLGLVGLVLFGLVAFRPSDAWLHDVLFLIFSSIAIIAGVATISQSNPVYAALWFAMVVLSSCGLFLLRSAPFLAAATIIVYAGAIIVTFLFVIMLAQQSGLADYDRASNRPWLAAGTGFALLAAMLFVFGQAWRGGDDGPSAGGVMAQSPLTPVVGLGTALYGQYFLSIELVGTLLTLAVVGAIVLAPGRGERSSARRPGATSDPNDGTRNGSAGPGGGGTLP